jgi:CubicO group peptidase (beta-lactamase class C family)
MSKELINSSMSGLEGALEIFSHCDHRSKLVDQLFSQYDRRDTPGCAIAIIQEGKIIYKRAYGMADLERDVPLTTKSAFDIGCTGKQFVAMCILLLSENGKISLNDDIRKYIPEIPDYGHTITIRHLIHNTSGIVDYCTLMSEAGMPLENHYTRKEILDLIARQKVLNFVPGDLYLEGNSGYFLLGEIVNRVSRESLSEYAEKNIFNRLDMKSTLINDDYTRIVKNRAISYFSKKNGGYGIANYLYDLVGDGGVMTTVEDLFHWDQNFYNNKLGEGKQELIRQFLTPGTLNNGEDIPYAFGLKIDAYKGLKIFSHDGDWAGYQAQLMRFLEKKISIACLANLTDFDPVLMAQKIADIYLEDKRLYLEESHFFTRI